MKLCVILVLSAILPVKTEFVYSLIILSGCSDSGNESAFLVSLDQNEIFYEDFNTKRQVLRLPSFINPFDIPDYYETAVYNRDRCLLNIKRTTEAIGTPLPAREPPEISIYPKHEVVPGEKNTFICFLKNFYPPHVRVNWTRDGVLVKEGVYLSQYSLNTDGTFTLFSTLHTTPAGGDEYSCTVEHEALNSPETRTWDEPVVTPSVTPTVVFAVGITVGILGLIIGIFFVILRHNFPTTKLLSLYR